MERVLIIGTRKSPLALWQSEYVRGRLLQLFPDLRIHLKLIVTHGDQTQERGEALPEIGGKGLFTAELEDCLASREIDLAVHSLKDLPTTCSHEFMIGAVPERGPVADVLISRSGQRLCELKDGAVVGTSSVRRASQLLSLRPDLRIVSIRGNIDTRIRKLKLIDGEYDAIVLAHAGLTRLGLEGSITQVFSESEILPAPAQGALGIECRAGDDRVLSLVSRLHDLSVAAAVGAERAFLQCLGAGCNTPVAALATVKTTAEGEMLVFQGRCLSVDGSMKIDISGEAAIDQADDLGRRMAQQAVAQGFTKDADR